MAETPYQSARSTHYNLELSEGQLLMSIARYQRLMVESLVASDPATRRMASIYSELARERRALLLAFKDRRPGHCSDDLN